MRLNGMSSKVDVDSEAVISRISLSRLIEGGAAMFAQTIKNHHIDKIGEIAKIPLVKAILRVCVYS
jgi:hypothetical protein